MLIRLAILVFGATLAVGLVACGGGSDDGDGGNDYPQSVVDGFMDSCSDGTGATESECQCAIDEIQKAYTLEEFTALAIDIANTGNIPTELAGPIANCIE